MIKIEAFMADVHAVGTEQRFVLKLSCQKASKDVCLIAYLFSEAFERYF